MERNLYNKKYINNYSSILFYIYFTRVEDYILKTLVLHMPICVCAMYVYISCKPFGVGALFLVDKDSGD